MARQVIFDRKNILVIGGAGFIGAHVCTTLVEYAKVICIDNYSAGSVDNVAHLLQNPNFVFLKADINDPLDFESFPELEAMQIKFQGIQEVYFMASPTVELGFEQFAIETIRTNSVGVINALEIARKYNAKFFLASTHSIYGDPLEGQESFQEEYWGFVNHLNQRACYNEGKRFSETITMTYHQRYNMDTKIGRIFNTYGPGMRLHSGRMIPDFIRAASDHQDLTIYGDGSSEDSYCYVDDMVQGIVALMQSPVNEPINLGNMNSMHIIDVAKKIIQFTGSKSNIVFADELVGLAKFAVPDITKAKRLLGWFPMTNIDIGLQRTIQDMLGSRVLTYHPLVSGKSS